MLEANPTPLAPPSTFENSSSLPESSPKKEEKEEDRQKNPSVAPTQADLYPLNSSKSTDIPLRVYDAPALREPLSLARALKPIAQRFPSGRDYLLDEIATTQKIADEGVWLPVFCSSPEPWLRIELVIDESISLQIWHSTIKELARVLTNYGMFRDVRIWGLVSQEEETVKLRRTNSQSLYSPKEIIDINRRSLVLVVSDCVARGWRNGKISQVLDIWAKNGKLAILQMLPQGLWPRSALGDNSEVWLRALNREDVNQQLLIKPQSPWEDINYETGIKVPIFTLEPDKLAPWAQMLAVRGESWARGVIFTTEVLPESEIENLTEQLTPQERVQAFRITTSPVGRKLAGLLAAAPVITLPVVRLIQETMLPNCLQVNVAEVFLGGLLKPLTEITPQTNPDEVQYGFMAGVRELLIESVPTDYVIDVISRVLQEKVGLSLQEFVAYLRIRKQEGEEMGYFATMTAEVLRCLGGSYAQMVEGLEESYEPSLELKNVRLTGPQIKKLRQAILTAYDQDWLDMLLLEEMDIEYRAIAQGANYETRVFKLIQSLEAQGKIGELIQAIVNDRPDNQDTQKLKDEFPELFAEETEDTIVDVRKLYEHLLKLGYERQVQEFVKLIQTQSLGAFVIHGSLNHGQKWLLNRLVEQYVPQTLNALTINIDFSTVLSRFDINSLWRRLGQDSGLQGEFLPKEIVKKIYRRWQTESVLIVIHCIHLIPQDYLEIFIKEFWHPLVDMASGVEKNRDSRKLLMFLIDYEGSIQNLEDVFSEAVDPSKPEKPLLSPAISKFTEEQVIDWIVAEYNDLPINLTHNFNDLAKTIIRESNEGIPEEVLEEIFRQCNHDFNKEMRDLWKI